MVYYAEEIKKCLEDNFNTVVLYVFGGLQDEYGEDYATVYSWEFQEHIDRVASAFDELLSNRQIALTVENIKFLLEYELIGITCNPHIHSNEQEMNELCMQLYNLFMKKLKELDSREWSY